MPFPGISSQVEEPVDPGVPGGGENGGGSLPNPQTPDFPGLPSITLTTADGTVFDLSNPEKMLAIAGRGGFDGASYDVYSDESPSVDGEIFRSARALARTLTLPMYVRAEAREDFLILKRALLARLAPTRGLMTLTVAEPDGSKRSIYCHYVRGAEGEGDTKGSGRTWVRYELELRAPDPYWRGDAMHFEWRAAESYLFLGNTTFLPFRVSSSQTFGATSFENPGDVDSHPVWTVVGPSTGGITLTRTTEGYPSQSLTLSSVLSPAQSLTVDTRSDRLTIKDNTGTNRWPDLTEGSILWKVTPGMNMITVGVGGSTAATRVYLDVEPRYEST